jgi:dTDP-4-dehydrorhamnose reductase
MTNVDLCETQKDLTTKINVNVTETLARGAAKKDTFF